MSVRFKVILIMLISVVFIVSIGTGVTFFFMQKKLYGSIRADLKFLAGACETLVSKEINSLRKNADLISASIIRDNILDREQEDIASYLSHASDSSDFTALSLLSKTKLIADSGNNAKKGTPAGIECLNTPYANAAFMGNTVLSTLTKDKNGNLVFYVFSPVGNDRIIAGTIPASYLNSLIESFRFISNGEIYVLDETGRIVASRDRGLVGVNYVSSMGYETDPRKLALGGIFKQMIGDRTGNYELSNSSDRVFFSSVRMSNGVRFSWPVCVSRDVTRDLAYPITEGAIATLAACAAIGVFTAFLASSIITRQIERSRKIDLQKSETHQLSDAKTRFFANISHEIRTPLNVIMGFLEILIGAGDKTADPRPMYDKMYNASTVLLDLVNDILDISKIEAGKFELHEEEYNTVSLVNDVLTLNIFRAGDRPITFRFVIDEIMPESLVGDELRVKQVFDNLLSNAFKYTREGSITWEVSCIWKDEKAYIKSTVRDTGIGIKTEDLAKLFVTSENSGKHTATGTAFQGSGMGLSIVSELVKMMGGTLYVESREGYGSTFSVEIPQATIGFKVIGKETADSLMKFVLGYKLMGQELADDMMDYSYVPMDRGRFDMVQVYRPNSRILIVDDVESNLEVAQALLRPYGIKTDTVMSGDEAIDYLKSGNRPDLIFLDYIMPDADGITTLKRIRNLGNEYVKNVPIVALTAEALIGSREIFIDEGFSDYISKPINVIELNDIIDSFLPSPEKETEEEEEIPEIKEPVKIKTKKPPKKDIGNAKRIDVPCLDFDRGLTLLGGNYNAYMNVLHVYVKSTYELLDKIRLIQSEDYADIETYRITIHGIKGVSYNIGSKPIGDLAFVLENAAKKGDLDFVREHTNNFIIQTTLFLESLAKEFEKSPASDKPKADAPDAEVLKKLMTACLDFDVYGADCAIAELDEYTYGKDSDLIEWLKEKVTDKDFDEVAEKLSAMEKRSV